MDEPNTSNDFCSRTSSLSLGSMPMRATHGRARRISLRSKACFLYLSQYTQRLCLVFTLLVTTGIVQARRLFERLFPFVIGEVDQAERADGIHEAETCQLIDQAGGQKHDGHVNAD